MIYKKLMLTLFLMLLVVIPSSAGGATTNSPRDYWPTESWFSSPPAEQDMNPTKIEAMINYIQEQHLAVDSVLIVRHGYIVHESYFNTQQDTPHLIYSCTKSIVSALIGIAIHEGYIESVDQKVLDFFPERNISNVDSRKQAMTLEHLLSMTSGLEWNELAVSYANSQNNYNKLVSSADWVQYVLDRPMVAEPGTVWTYNSGVSHLLSAILTKTTGNSTLAFAQKYLFEPLGISTVYWSTDPQGIFFGGSSIRLTTRDMAKFGYLYLNNGTWDEEQLVPADWVTKSTGKFIAIDSYTEYGYQWWIFPQLEVYLGIGYAGQRIIVIPKYDIVTVFTASTGQDGLDSYNLISNYIISAADSHSSNSYSTSYAIVLVLPGLFALVCWQKKVKKSIKDQ
ncbi:MAG: serine hydrolase domain-containing protein [Candidatus Hodarchaeota archaeon]